MILVINKILIGQLRICQRNLLAYSFQTMGKRHRTWHNSYSNHYKSEFGTWDKEYVFLHILYTDRIQFLLAIINLKSSTSAQCSLTIFFLALSNSSQKFLALTILIRFITLTTFAPEPPTLFWGTLPLIP